MKNTRLTLSLAAAALIGAVLPGQTFKLPPPDLKPGQKYRILCVTDGVRDATSAKISDYDAFVAADIKKSPGLKGLVTTWKAVASTPTVIAREHTKTPTATKGIAIYRPDGVRVANDYLSFWGTARRIPFLAAPNITSLGTATKYWRVWCGTYPTGVRAEPLGGTGTSARAGAPTYKTYSWLYGNVLPQTNKLPLYALSGVMTVPTKKTVQVDLNYNFNGIVHKGEAGKPDALQGYRSISDRGLDFSAGIPKDATLARYKLVDAAGSLDVVHLGNRNTVDFGKQKFDATADGDSLGVHPTWLTKVDQRTPQTTTLKAPFELQTKTTLGLIYQISNGGGSFTVTVTYSDDSTSTHTVSGLDWAFKGTLPGTRFDTAQSDLKLSITEAKINLDRYAGKSIKSLAFSNLKSTIFRGGIACAILGARIDTAAVPGVQLVRRGTPANPAAFLAPAKAPVIGTSWNPVIDHKTFVPNAVSDFIVFSLSKINVSGIDGVNGTLLCLPDVLGFGPVTGPGVGKPFVLGIPKDRALIGLQLTLQGGSFDKAGVAHLANALDVTIGEY